MIGDKETQNIIQQYEFKRKKFLNVFIRMRLMRSILNHLYLI